MGDLHLALPVPLFLRQDEALPKGRLGPTIGSEDDHDEYAPREARHSWCWWVKVGVHSGVYQPKLAMLR
jgi:hypothetical protein